MNTRIYFLLTAISGMIGLLSLITLSLCRFWVSENPLTELSDEGIDQLHNIILTSIFASHVSKAAIISFLVFFGLYFISRKKTNAEL